MRMSHPVFDEVISSPLSLPQSRATTLAALIFSPVPGENEACPLLFGTAGKGAIEISLGTFRRAILRLRSRLLHLGIGAGDTVCLIGLPRTSETLAIVVYAALATVGVRVFFPMFVDRVALGRWLSDTRAKAVLWAAEEMACNGSEADGEWLVGLEDEVRQAGVPAHCIQKDLRVFEALTDSDTDTSESSAQAVINELLTRGDANDVSLITSITGNSGRARLVAYTLRALLNTCASWEAAGFYSPSLLGGRGLCLLLAHSTGIAAFWNAVWTRQALCLVPPEWFDEHPERVRDLLVSMAPAHVTGGPAGFYRLLEFTRVFPQIKDTFVRCLRCLVSTGAAFDPVLSRRLEVTFKIPQHNAFEITETMQVLSTLAPGPLACGPGDLGNPLPGVSVGLERIEGEGAGRHFRLWVRSPFAGAGTLADDGADGLTETGASLPVIDHWYFSGDLVERTPHGGLRYVGRESDDFFKDGFGVRVSRPLLAERYAGLGEGVHHVEVFPLREEPGLAALVFVDGSVLGMKQPPAQGGWIAEHPVAKRVRGMIVARHEQWPGTLDDFECRHFSIDRFVCLAERPPMTPKGTVSRPEIERRFAPLLAQITGRFVRRDGFEQVPRERLFQSATVRLANPRRGEWLRLGRLDKTYERASGDRLSYQEKGQWHEVVDFVGGFGMNLFGHRHPDLLAAAERFWRGEQPWMADQGSHRRHEGSLARKLAARVGRETGRTYVVKFGSTGSEMVEMALAHAWLERQEQFRKWMRKQRRLFGNGAAEALREVLEEAHVRMRSMCPKVLVLDGSYHGQSLGSRALLSSKKTGPLYAAMARIEKVCVTHGNVEELEALLNQHTLRVPALIEEDGKVIRGEANFSSIIAAIAEPVRGEGGIAVAPIELLHCLERRDFPLVLDEIQCGLGRTGTFLASQGVRGDYYVFAKALGGGLAKIGALLIEQTRYVPRFDEDYAATFAGDAFSCAIAEEVLDLIERDAIVARADGRGESLRRRLLEIQGAHPTVIAAVTGRGLMQGIVLNPDSVCKMFSLRMAERHEMLGMVAASFLLHRHSVRLLPTLSAFNTLRLEPSAYIDDLAIEQLAKGLEAFCCAVENSDSATLLDCLVDDEMEIAVAHRPETDLPTFFSDLEPPRPGAERVAFFGHFVLPERDIVLTDPSMQRLPPAARCVLVDKLMQLTEMKPTPIFSRHLFDHRVWFNFVFFAVDAPTIEHQMRSGHTALLVERIQAGVDLAAAAGCRVGALGAYTSIVTDDGRALLPPSGMQLTTGNTMTVAVGMRRVHDACVRWAIELDREDVEIAVIGATGNIGSAIAEQFATTTHCRHLTLVARQPERLRRLSDRLAQSCTTVGQPSPVLKIATEMDAVRTAQVIVVATSTSEPLLYPHHLRTDRSVIVVDLSAPAAVSPEVLQLPMVKVVPFAGTVTVPGCPDFVMASYIEPGSAFCCAAEAMLLGLMPEDERRRLRLIGPIDASVVGRFDRLAQQMGFYEHLGDGGFHPSGS